MKKITEIKVEQAVTRHVKDENGQRVKKQVRLIVNRAVELVPEKKEFGIILLICQFLGLSFI